MAYQLPPDIDQRVQLHLSHGVYQTPADVLKDALDALDARYEDLESIRRGIEDEKAGRLTSLEDFDKDMRTRYGFAPKQ